MKKVKKCLALVLALCFFAVVPLSALAAEDYNTCMLGSWKTDAVYHTKSNDIDFISDSTGTLTVNANGTAVYSLYGKTYTATWSYQITSDGFHIYYMIFSDAGVEESHIVMYSLTNDIIEVFEGDDIYIYVRA